MTPEQWLTDNVEGYGSLKADEKEAIKYFALLWSLFEHKMLGNDANARKICDLMRDIEARQQIDLTLFGSVIGYFSHRYYQNGSTTQEFDGLRLRAKPDNQALVESVLRGEPHSAGEVISAYLIIVYRLRNNLFHGEKWKYMIRGQLGNFQNANALLMAVLDL